MSPTTTTCSSSFSLQHSSFSCEDFSKWRGSWMSKLSSVKTEDWIKKVNSCQVGGDAESKAVSLVRFHYRWEGARFWQQRGTCGLNRLARDPAALNLILYNFHGESDRVVGARSNISEGLFWDMFLEVRTIKMDGANIGSESQTV